MDFVAYKVRYLLLTLSILLQVNHSIVSASEAVLTLDALDSYMLERNSTETGEFRANSQIDKQECQYQMVPLLRPIETKEVVDIRFQLPPLKKGVKRTYYPFNPSIVKNSDGYYVICRTANVGPFHKLLEGEIPTNKNYLLKYDRDFNLLSEVEIVVPKEFLSNIRENFQVEDCRIFEWNGSYWFVGNILLTDKSATQKMSICRFDDMETARIGSLTIFPGPEAERREKNWMPLMVGGELKFIYSYDPFVLFDPNIENGECKEALNYTPVLDLNRFRGSAAPIDFEGGYLMMVHERIEKNIIHRFVYMDKKLNIRKYSLPFIFNHVGIEYCASMCLDHSGKNLIVPIGIRDDQAKILIVDVAHVKSMLVKEIQVPAIEEEQKTFIRYLWEKLFC